MKKLHFIFLFLVFLSFSAFAQEDLELFQPLPTRIQKITAVQYYIYEGDTTSVNFLEYNFDRRKNLTRWEYFPYHVQEELKYDSLDRIIEIDGLYGESFGNGIIKYYYPSKNQKKEIHDKMGYYKYIKSDFEFYENEDLIHVEITYDSTFNLIDSSNAIKTTQTKYFYDNDENKIGHLVLLGDEEILIEKAEITYQEGQLITKKIFKFDNSSIKQTYQANLESYDYILEGNFKNRIAKKIITSIYTTDSTKNEIHFSYKKVDSLSNIQEQKYFTDYSDDKEYLQNTVTEKSYFRNGKLTRINKYFYRYNRLIALEEYHISEEEKSEPKLESWTEYSYFLYPKTKDKKRK
ncbi:hypothetical protein [Bernardetia sp. MNP-M8]|uniref:hypothetical protein n=1 Tax=Bernardetia sp. MNP-M8 TaxID=3127470 RepID=UPI0030D361C6